MTKSAYQNSMSGLLNDEYFMRLAIKEANTAFEKGEIPVGALIVSKGHILAKAHNQTERLKDVSAHAEMLTITAAANYLNSKYLKDCTLYVTLEPCVMCAGALYWSQIDRIVYGASDPKRGCLRFDRELIHPKTEIVAGVLEEECSQLMKTFFSSKR